MDSTLLGPTGFTLTHREIMMLLRDLSFSSNVKTLTRNKGSALTLSPLQEAASASPDTP